jgi:hypothetical protein
VSIWALTYKKANSLSTKQPAHKDITSQLEPNKLL